MLIALSGRKRHGKDTVADRICKIYNYKKYSLASPFKQLMCHHFSFTPDEINGINTDRESILTFSGVFVADKFKKILISMGYSAYVYTIDWSPIENKNDWSIRTLMQTIGTDIGCNQVDKLIWMHPMVDAFLGTENLIVSDARQIVEINLLRKLGAKVIHINNPWIQNTDTHITEAGLPILDDDVVIENSFNPLNSDIQYINDCLLGLHSKIDEVINGFIDKNT